jgi:hypothetical protein
VCQLFTYDVATLIEPIESKPSLWDKTRGYVLKERVTASFQISYSQHWMYPVLSFAFFVFSPKIQEHKQVALPISMHKHFSCAAFNTRQATGSGTAGTCAKLHTGAGSGSGKKPVCVCVRACVCVCASGLKLRKRCSFSYSDSQH